MKGCPNCFGTTLVIAIISAIIPLSSSALAQRPETEGVAWGRTLKSLRLGVAIQNTGAQQQLRILFQNTGKTRMTIFVGSFYPPGPPGYNFKVWAIGRDRREEECFIFSTGSGFGQLILYRGMGRPISAQIPPGRTYEIKLPTTELVKGERLSDIHLSKMLEQGYKVKISYYYPAGLRSPDWPDEWVGGEIVSGEIGLQAPDR